MVQAFVCELMLNFVKKILEPAYGLKINFYL